MNPTNSKNPTNPIHVPILDLTRQYEMIKPEIDAAIGRVLESGRFILGPEVEAFEQEIDKYCNVKHAIGVASGTDALWLSLKVAGVGPGDRVITTPFTFFATAGAVVNLGARPAFIDIDPQTYNIDPVKLRELLENTAEGELEQFKALIPVHLYGQMAEMGPIMEVAHEYGLAVIEDAAQAIGSEYQGKRAGTVGDLGIFSFFPTKNLGAYGDGGMVITDDDGLAERVRLLRVHGSRPKYYHHFVGTNSRLDSLQAAILQVKLPRLDRWSQARQQCAERYNKLLRELDSVELPFVHPSSTHVYHQYTIRIKDGRRDELRSYLKEQGIGTGVYYPLPLHLQECFKDLGYQEGDFPEAEQASREVLSLPMFPELTEEEQLRVVSAIEEFFQEK